MKSASSVLCFGLLAVFAVDSAAARPITVKLTAHVTGWTDYSGTDLGGQVFWGRNITASYTYETNAIGQFGSYPGDLLFRPPSLAPVNARVVAGTLVLESIATPQQFDIHVNTSTPAGPYVAGTFWIASNENKLLAPGAWGAGLPVNQIAFRFYDMTGRPPPLTALPADAPDLQYFSDPDIRIVGGSYSDNTFFEINARIDSAELAPPEIEISPSAGNFLSQQRFDAALVLPIGSQIASAHASVGSLALPFAYPGTCQLIAPGGGTRPAVLCPDAHTALPTAAGAPIEWQVELTDGTVLTERSEWRLIQ
jgi:hypothetical protein